MSTVLQSKLEHEKPGFKRVTPGRFGALHTSEIQRRLTSIFPSLAFPFIEQDHLHGVVSDVHTLCKEHGVISRIGLSGVLYGGTKYGCDVCAAVNGSHNRKASLRFNDQNMSRKKLQSGIFLAVKAICPDTQWEVTLPDGKELDIYIPSLKLGIEHNGLYWHSTQIKDDKFYHSNKNNSAACCDIAVIHVWEDLAVYPFTTITNMVRLAKLEFRHNRRRGRVHCIDSVEALAFHSAWNIKPVDMAAKCENHVAYTSRGKVKAVLSMYGDHILAASYNTEGVPFRELLAHIKDTMRFPKIYLVADCLTPTELSIARHDMTVEKMIQPIAWNLDANNHLCTISGQPPSGNVVWDCGHIVLSF